MNDDSKRVRERVTIYCVEFYRKNECFDPIPYYVPIEDLKWGAIISLVYANLDTVMDIDSIRICYHVKTIYSDATVSFSNYIYKGDSIPVGTLVSSATLRQEYGNKWDSYVEQHHIELCSHFIVSKSGQLFPLSTNSLEERDYFLYPNK